MKRPAFQFYPADWRKDPALSACSLSARGLWIELMCIAHESDLYGHLSINERAMTPQQIARMVGDSPATVAKLLDELERAGVFSRNADGVIYSRRMVKDERLRNVRAESGRLGGNPDLLNQKVNQKVKQKVIHDYNHDPNQEANQDANHSYNQAIKQDGKQSPTPSSSSSSSSSSSIPIVEEGERGNVGCAEQLRGSPPAVTALPLADGSEFSASGEDASEWRRAFPDVDVGQEMRRMRVWLLANPQKRKTARGVRSFVVRWLGKARDGAKRVAPDGSKVVSEWLEGVAA